MAYTSEDVKSSIGKVTLELLECDYCKQKQTVIMGQLTWFVVQKADIENAAHFCSRECVGAYFK